MIYAHLKLQRVTTSKHFPPAAGFREIIYPILPKEIWEPHFQEWECPIWHGIYEKRTNVCSCIRRVALNFRKEHQSVNKMMLRIWGTCYFPFFSKTEGWVDFQQQCIVSHCIYNHFLFPEFSRRKIQNRGWCVFVFLLRHISFLNLVISTDFFVWGGKISVVG